MLQSQRYCKSLVAPNPQLEPKMCNAFVILAGLVCLTGDNLNLNKIVLLNVAAAADENCLVNNNWAVVLQGSFNTTINSPTITQTTKNFSHANFAG